MELIYLGHSGMLVHGEKASFLMDYYLDKGAGPGLCYGVMDAEGLSLPGRLYVLISHSHGDHLNPVVFDYENRREDVVYIVAREAKAKVPEGLRSPVVFLEKGESYRDELALIRAYGSTDLGISFYVEAEGKRFFHAGDLNDWHWNQEVPPEEAEGYTRAFQEELKDLSHDVSQLDLAMFPVDGRLGPDAANGAITFLSAIPTRVFAPMHFGEGYQAQDGLIAGGPFPGTQVLRWTRRGERAAF
jgi:L-ascorbate metabolism protein UlaG (beta-lactamase superfamily)